MSFSKAKRFNEISSCTPSPSQYNINTNVKIKFGVIGRSGSFTKKNDSPSNSETDSVYGTPFSQTPCVPLARRRFLSYGTSKEELREKIVECTNKDLYIKDLTQQIEEMCMKLKNMSEAYDRLQEQKVDREMVLEATRLKSKQVLEKITKNFKGVNKELEEIKKQCQTLKDENLVDLSKILGCMGQFQELYDKTAENHQREMDELNAELLEKDKGLQETEARFRNLETELTKMRALAKLEMKQKAEEVAKKLEEKDKKYNELLREQQLKESKIKKGEIEKKQLRDLLEEKEKKIEEQQKEIHKFMDTIEVLKKCVLESDNSVEQLKMQLETSKENNRKQLLLSKIETLKSEASQLKINMKLMEDMLLQYPEQQTLINKTQELISSFKPIEASQIDDCAEIRRNYIEMKEKYENLFGKFEQRGLELDAVRLQLTRYQAEMHDLGGKYADLLGHQNHLQKIKHVCDLKCRYMEQMEKNVALEQENERLHKLLKESEKKKKGKENYPGPLKDKN